MIRLTLILPLALLLLIANRNGADARTYAAAANYELVSKDAECSSTDAWRLKAIAGISLAAADYLETQSSYSWSTYRGEDRRELEEAREREMLSACQCKTLCKRGAYSYCACAQACRRRRLLRGSDTDDAQDDEQRRRLVERVRQAEDVALWMLEHSRVECVRKDVVKIYVDEF
jgi:hypothetical protein